jgi:LuxR family maltose regulon positive regulatory protein
MQQAAEEARDSLPDYVRQELIARQVHLELDRDRVDAAHLACTEPAEVALQNAGYHDGALAALLDGTDFSYSAGLLANSVLRLRLHRARDQRDLSNLASGIELADRLIARAEAGQYTQVVLEALLLRAQMSALCGDGANPGTARADYLRALELGQPQGFLAVFVEQGAPVHEALANLQRQNRLGTAAPDYVKRILAAFSGPQGAPPAVSREEAGPAAALPEPLTDRELEVLRLLAGGMKYRDIAETLFVSVNTVRYHVKAIYGKLEVHNRTQAVEVARELQLL